MKSSFEKNELNKQNIKSDKIKNIMDIQKNGNELISLNSEIYNNENHFHSRTFSNFKYINNKGKSRKKSSISNNAKKSVESNLIYQSEIHEKKQIFLENIVNLIKNESVTNTPFPRSAQLKIRPNKISSYIINNREKKIIISNDNLLQSHQKTNSLKGIYYKKRNNSVILVNIKDRDIYSSYNIKNDFNKKIFRPENESRNNDIKFNNEQNSSRRLKNLTVERLKDLLDIKPDNNDLYAENNKNSNLDMLNRNLNLNPFDTYLEKTRIENKRNLLKEDKLYDNTNIYKNKSSKKVQNKNILSDSLDDKTKAQEKIEIDQDIIFADNKDNDLFKNENLGKNKNLEIKEKEIISSGVQCGIYLKSEENNPRKTQSANVIKKRLNEIFNNNIITNAKIRDKVKWEKIKIKDEEDENLININLYNSEFIDGKNEIFKLYLQNKIKNDSRFKVKTPHDLKSKMSTKNMQNDIKISSAKSKQLNKVYKYSYSKDLDLIQSQNFEENTNENIIQNSFLKIKATGSSIKRNNIIGSLNNFYKINDSSNNPIQEKFKKFKQINNLDEANNFNKKRIKNKVIKLSYPSLISNNIEENVQILSKRIHSPEDKKYIKYNNINYNFNRENFMNNNLNSDHHNNNEIQDPQICDTKHREEMKSVNTKNNYDPDLNILNKNQKEVKYIEYKDNDEAIKCYFDDKVIFNKISNNCLKGNNENNCNNKNIINCNYMNDNCNTSNGFNNPSDLNFFDKNTNKIQINLNNLNNNKIFSSHNSNLNMFSQHANSPSESKERPEFLEKVNWNENKTAKIITGGKFKIFNKIFEKEKIMNIKKFNIHNSPTTYHKRQKSSVPIIPNVVESQYYNDDHVKDKFKILKRQIDKNSQKANHMLDNLKRIQYDLFDSKRKFFLDSDDNKLKKSTRRSFIMANN